MDDLHLTGFAGAASRDVTSRAEVAQVITSTTRQYGDCWTSGGAIGLEPRAYGTHSHRRTKVALIYKRTGNLRACQLLLGYGKIESTLGIEVDDALALPRRPGSNWLSVSRQGRHRDLDLGRDRSGSFLLVGPPA